MILNKFDTYAEAIDHLDTLRDDQEKLAFWAPFKSKSIKEHKTPKGYFKEYGNMVVGSLPGTVPLGAMMLAARKATGSPPNPALVLGALGLAHTGMYKAIKKGERAAGVKKDKGTTVPRYIGRSAFGQIVPIAGDYIVREGTQYK